MRKTSQTINNFTFKRQYSLLMEMVRTDFKLRYQGSVLGYVWSLLKPLFIFAILYVVFVKFLRFGAGVPNYAFSLLLAIVLWNFFAESTAGALKSIVGKGNLIRKIYIPRYIIPTAAIASALINMFLNMIVFFVFLLVFANNTALSLETIIMFPLFIVELIVFTTGVGFFLATLYVKFRDIDYIWEVVRQALFYGIPIIYTLARVPYDSIKKFIMINPLSQIIQGSRATITNSETITTNDVFGSSYALLIPLTIVLITLAVGVWYFLKQQHKFAENV